MRESRLYGSVRGARGNSRPYRYGAAACGVIKIAHECATRFKSAHVPILFEEPVSLKTGETLPALAAAIKIEGRQRGRAYVTTALHRVDRRERLAVTAAATDVH
jgi:collagenase-like PrtC family protease